jgi:hypothetical protein
MVFAYVEFCLFYLSLGAGWGVIISPTSDDNGENPALDGWTELDGSLARAFPDPPGDDFSKAVHDSTCTKEINVVMPRRVDSSDGDMRREYTVTDSSFGQATTQRDCANIEELLSAVKHGRREWKDGRANESKGSVFVAAGCRIPHASPAEVKNILAKPARLAIGGDSLSRHMNLGLTLLHSGDYVDGGMTKANPAWMNCRCDGHFSEALICRKLAVGATEKTLKNKHNEYTLTYRDCKDDGSPHVFWLQGGAHFKSSSQKAIAQWFAPEILRIRKRHKRHGCPGSPVIFVSGLNSQSRSLDKHYGWQSRENAASFNEELANHLADWVNWIGTGPFANDKIFMVDFMNLTMDAPTSDGYHYLTDVNTVKADVLVALVDMVYREWQTAGETQPTPQREQ